MGRRIDPENIDADDVRFLQERPWMIDEYKRQGYIEQMTAVEEGLPSPGDQTDASLITLQEMSRGHNPQEGQQPREGIGDANDELLDNYEEWTVDELKAEVDARNGEPDRAPELKIQKTGTKAELVDRLHKDDEVEVTA